MTVEVKQTTVTRLQIRIQERAVVTAAGAKDNCAKTAGEIWTGVAERRSSPIRHKRGRS